MKKAAIYITVILSALSCLLLAGCAEEVYESDVILSDGYWLPAGQTDGQLIKFSTDGHLFRYDYRYESGQNRYYAVYDEINSDRYMLDKVNSRLCLLKDNQWYSIYVLTEANLTVSDSEHVSYKLEKVSESRVEILSRKEFTDKYPD